MMKKWLLILYMLPLLVPGQDFQPKSVNGELVNHTCFSLSYFEAHEQPEWVYYKLTPSMVNGFIDRTDDFRSDPFISTGSASLSDYKGSGYDRGHLVPASDMKLSKTSMSESFFLSNMSPQNPSFNRGGWKKLEMLVRSWALSEDELFIVTGPVFRDNPGVIGSNRVTIPGYYFKVIYSDRNKEMIGFVLPNRKVESNLKSYVKAVDFIEEQTGLDFFYQLDDDTENALESSTRTEQWNFDPALPATTQK
ncbi:MAG: DNA/RNA non-specific endonuclease [Ekhidna sp.]|nr:DNA/RNA non-specific endonuclease [Ekhidna sp.]